MTKHKSHDERRAQILAAAKTCFINNGYAHTRVDDIATEAGLSKGGIYFHFKSKRQIFDALHADQQAQTMGLLDSASALEGSATSRLEQLAMMLIQHFAMAEDHRKFLIVLAEMGMRDEALHTNVLVQHDRYVQAISRQIRDGVERGEFRDVDPDQIALFLKFVVDGVEQGLALGYQFDATQLLSASMDLIFNGIRKTS